MPSTLAKSASLRELSIKFMDRLLEMSFNKIYLITFLLYFYFFGVEFYTKILTYYMQYWSF